MARPRSGNAVKHFSTSNSTPDQDAVRLRHAEVTDVPAIAALIEPHVQRRVLLPRSIEQLRDLTRNGFVAESGGRLVGFAAVDIYSKKLAELQCLAVADDYRGMGVGHRLVRACVDCARRHDVQELMAITSAEDFFQDCGFDYTLPDQKKAFFISTRPRK
jgi:N-acetylglutamate synthase-like GNAT family acetyltransferase